MSQQRNARVTIANKLFARATENAEENAECSRTDEYQTTLVIWQANKVAVEARKECVHGAEHHTH